MIVGLIPAYNSVHTIAEVITKSLKFLDVVIVYDDGSTDATVDVARQCGAEVICGEENRGKGFALRALFTAVLRRKEEVKIVVTIDADMQHDPFDIPRLVEPIENDEYDIVVGERKRKLGFRRIAAVLLSRTRVDMLSGLRAYNLSTLKKIQIVETGYGVDQEIMDLMKERDARIGYVEIGEYHNKFSHSKNSASQFYEIFNYVFLKHPLLNLGLVGLLCFVLGVIGVWRVLTWWERYHQIALGTFLLSNLILLFGALTFFTGLILHVLQKEVRKR